MEKLIANYKQYEAIILFVAAWLLSIPTGIFIVRLDTYLQNRSKKRKIKAILTHHARVVIEGRKMMEAIRNSGNDFRSFILKGPPFVKGPLITMFLNCVIIFILTISSGLVTSVYGETASDWYFYISVALVFLINTPVAIYYQNQQDILNDAVRFDKYKEKAVAQLKELGANPNELDRLESIARLARNK